MRGEDHLSQCLHWLKFIVQSAEVSLHCTGISIRWVASLTFQVRTVTPPKSNMPPEKGPFQKEIVFQPSFFRGYVSFQVSNLPGDITLVFVDLLSFRFMNHRASTGAG